MRGVNQLWDYNGNLNGKETYKNKCWAGLFMIRLQRGNLRGERCSMMLSQGPSSPGGHEDPPRVDDLLGSFRWYDALCINQDDPKEKAHQVSLMGAIYSSSIQTIIWLGLASDNSGMGMDLVGNISKGDFEIQSLNAKLAEWKAPYAIMSCSWWSRLWTIQEACLSKQAIVKCGRKEVDLSKFRELYKLHQQANRDRAKYLPPIFRSLFANVSFGFVLSR
jgi:hypothetical protein